MPPMSSNLAIKIEQKKRRTFSVYYHGGIAKRHCRNKQSTPTPLSNISRPHIGERIRDKHRLLTIYPSTKFLAIFRDRIKQKRFFNILPV